MLASTATIRLGELKVSGTVFIAIWNLQQASPVASRSSRGGSGASKSARDYREGAAQPQGKKVTSDKTEVRRSRRCEGCEGSPGRRPEKCQVRSLQSEQDVTTEVTEGTEKESSLFGFRVRSSVGSVLSVVQERKHATRKLVQFSRHPIGARGARGRPSGYYAGPRGGCA
jgi:hypothetical protein